MKNEPEIKRVFRDFQQDWLGNEADEIVKILEECESPIEIMFGWAMIFIHMRYTLFGRDPIFFPDRNLKGELYFKGYTLIPQFEEGNYRIDFLYGHSKYSGIRIAIECDGYDFHERTKDQARRDREKDRYLQSIGYIVLRFTGSEIYNDPIGKAREARNIMDNKIYDAFCVKFGWGVK